MKNNSINEGPVRLGGLSENTTNTKPDIKPAGQGIVDIGTVLTQIRNARVALYAGDKGSAMAALKKAEKILVGFYNKC